MRRISKPLPLIGRGALLGAASGGVLSVAYTAAVIPLAGLLLVFTNIPGGKVFDALIGAGVFAICAWPFAMALGILPGIILGVIGGMLIGLIVAPFRDNLSSRGAALIGLIVAAAIVVSGHLVLGRGLIDPNRVGFVKYLPYLFWLAGPGLLILSGLTWVGWTLLTVSRVSRKQ